MSACRDFRALLLHELEGSLAPAELSRLSWHEHLLGCEPCKQMLAEEEALEFLLTGQPEPRLPAELARRVLVRLRAQSPLGGPGLSSDSLDRLLALDAEPPVPAELAGSVLGGLRAKRAQLAEKARRGEARLDDLLDADPGIPVPEGLADRVLDGLDAERFPRRVARFSSYAPRVFTAIAAGVLVLFVLTVALRYARALRDGERLPEPVVDSVPVSQPATTNGVAEPLDEVARNVPAGADVEVAAAEADFIQTLEQLEEEALLDKLDVLVDWELLADLDSAELDLVTTFVSLEDEVLIELDEEWGDSDEEDGG